MSFPLKTRSELANFDRLCLSYGQRHKFMVCDLPALRLLLDELMKQDEDERHLWRLMALAYEIKIGLVQSHYDLAVIAGLENKYWVPAHTNIARGDPLGDQSLFEVAFRRARSAFGLIMRIRALWDKSLHYIGLRYIPDDYNEELRSKKGSPRKAILNLAKDGIGPLTRAELDQIEKDIAALEESFRTPEAHGYGSIRTWAFDPISSWPVRESAQLMAHWNLLHQTIGRIFKKASTNITSFGDPYTKEDWTAIK